jgi:hypothetical protein
LPPTWPTILQPTILRLDRDDAEFERAWNGLAELTGGDFDEQHAESRERWQYMGTSRTGGGLQWVHQFRHRDRPEPAMSTRLEQTGQVYVDEAASPDFKPEQTATA